MASARAVASANVTALAWAAWDAIAVASTACGGLAAGLFCLSSSCLSCVVEVVRQDGRSF